tara:strand:- start:3072 stop:3755 length:684 start_codon:yes stop_codon:yes gene_type:complete
MKRTNKIILLLFALIFLTTYNPKQLNFTEKDHYSFFKIKNIQINNNKKIRQKDVIERLNHIYGKNIISLSNNDIQNSLLDIDFLKKIELKKKYPSTIIVKIYETEVLGILYKNKDKFFLDSSSNLLRFKEDIYKGKLPEIFGKGAENDFVNFFKELDAYQFPKNKIKRYYYFKINRWDLKLLDGKLIKFPAKKRKEAIQQSIELLNRDDFKNYKVLDLRIHGKIVVE